MIFNGHRFGIDCYTCAARRFAAMIVRATNTRLVTKYSTKECKKTLEKKQCPNTYEFFVMH